MEEIVLPESDYRSYIATKSTQDVKTPICDVKITTKVPAWTIVNPGFFSADYCLFSVETEIGGSSGERHKV